MLEGPVPAAILSTKKAIPITDAAEAHSEEQRRRVVKYLSSMAIRTACVLGIIMVQGAWQWVLLIGAVILPYLAVVVANQPTPKAVFMKRNSGTPSQNSLGKAKEKELTA